MVSVLLVEDDASLRKQMRFSLEDRFDLFEAGDRDDALDILRNHPIDIMILDLGLTPCKNLLLLQNAAFHRLSALT